MTNPTACQLKPCPFCGGHAHWCMCNEEGCHRIECDGCKFQLDAVDLPDDIESINGLREIMQSKWNTRATEGEAVADSALIIIRQMQSYAQAAALTEVIDGVKVSDIINWYAGELEAALAKHK